MTPVNRTAPQFAELLSRALTEPGVVTRAYSAVHGYSVGNQILAFVQCAERGIMPGPIATFMGWKDKGRYVRKGSAATAGRWLIGSPSVLNRSVGPIPAVHD